MPPADATAPAGAAAPEAPAGVIHDIGYRGYDGDRLTRRWIALALYTHSLRGIFGLGRSARSKLMPMGLFVFCLLPALVIAVMQVALGMPEPLVAYTAYATNVQAVLTIFVAVAAPQTVSLDLRFGTLPLYLSRPLERVDYVRAKLLALSTAAFVLLAVPLLVLYAGALAAELDGWEQTVDLAAGLAGAAGFAVVLSGIALVIAAMTPRRGFGIAGIVTVMTLSATIVSGLQAFIRFDGDVNNPDLAGWIGLFSPAALVDGIQVWAFGATSSWPAPPPDGAGPVFLAVAVAVVAACHLFLSLRYRKVTL